MAVNLDFITEILRRFEGRPATRGYLPVHRGRVMGNSGVTVGTGVDLGQQSKPGLEGMGVPPELVSCLLPYLGKKREEARAFLAANPLQLDEADVRALDSAVIRHYVNRLERRFNREAARCGASFFADRKKEIQAVGVSLDYQLGPQGWPATLKMLAAGRYALAAAELRDPLAWNGYRERREAEAGLLEQAGTGERI